MGGLFKKPKRNHALEAAQMRQNKLIREREDLEKRDFESRRRARVAAQSARQRGVQNAIQPAAVTRRLGGG